MNCPRCGDYMLDRKNAEPFCNRCNYETAAARGDVVTVTNCAPCKRCGGPRTPIEGAPSIADPDGPVCMHGNPPPCAVCEALCDGEDRALREVAYALATCDHAAPTIISAKSRRGSFLFELKVEWCPACGAIRAEGVWTEPSLQQAATKVLDRRAEWTRKE